MSTINLGPTSNWCPLCGEGVNGDDDGCCSTCGSTLILESVRDAMRADAFRDVEWHFMKKFKDRVRERLFTVNEISRELSKIDRAKR